jgi:hypothetical protein
VAAIEEEGRDKPRWRTCGVAFVGEKGTRIKIESIPVGPGWDGWFNLFEPQDEGERKPAKAAKPAAKDFDDDIAF